MQRKSFSGNPFEIGEQQGRIYRANGMNFDHIRIDEPLFKRQLQAYRTHYPEMLDEFRGMAKAGNYDEEKLIYKFITEEILWFRKAFNLKACTIFGVQNENGAFVGRNYDWHPATESVFSVYRVSNPKRNSFVAVTDMGIGTIAKPAILYYNADDAINDRGLFIGLTFAFADSWSYGLSCIHMTKLIAETCEDVDDAIRVFKEVPLCCPKNFFVADKHGNMAVVEHTSSKSFKVVYPRDGVLIQTNNYVDPELAKKDTVLKHRPHHNTFLRYDKTLEEVNQRKETFKLPDVMKILGNSKSCVCQNHPSMKTIWSLAMDMTYQRYKLYWDISRKRKERTLQI